MDATLAREVYYKPSGKFGPLSLVTIPALGAIGALIGGFAYSYAVNWIPFIYINILLTIAYGFLVGFMIDQGASLGKLRNPALGVLLGLVVGVFAIYTQWVAHFYAVSNQTQLIWNSAALWEAIARLNETGSWSIGRAGEPVSGLLLYVVWGVEAIIMLGLTVFMAQLAAHRLFCEGCGKWTDYEETFGPFAPFKDKKDVKLEMENENFSALENITTATDLKKYATITLEGCDTRSCYNLSAVTAQIVKVTENKKGESETDETAVVEGLLINKTTRDRLINSLKETQKAGTLTLPED